jgi:hypothetical protein
MVLRVSCISKTSEYQDLDYSAKELDAKNGQEVLAYATRRLYVPAVCTEMTGVPFHSLVLRFRWVSN